jgi:hypothetical protein
MFSCKISLSTSKKKYFPNKNLIDLALNSQTGFANQKF